MQSAAISEIIDGDQLLAVQLAHQHDAGIDGLIDDAAVAQRSKCHGAGAAVAFITAFLGAARFLLETEIVEYSARGSSGAVHDHSPSSQETDLVAHHDRQLPR